MFEKCICLVCLGGPRRPQKLSLSVSIVSESCLSEIAHYCQSGATFVNHLAYRLHRVTFGRSAVHSGEQGAASGFCS